MFVLFFIGFVTVITVAPHNDIKMRGFTPCTYQMTEKLMSQDTLKQSEVIGIVVKGYACYFRVIGKGFSLFYNGRQTTPWANYLFKSETNTEEEGFDEELLQNNLFKEDEKKGDLLDNVIKESENE